MGATVQDVFDHLERPYPQSAADSEELSTASVAARSLQAATALWHKLRSHADTAGDGRDEGLRRNELALLQCHLHWLLNSSSAQLRGAGEHAVSISLYICCLRGAIWRLPSTQLKVPAATQNADPVAKRNVSLLFVHVRYSACTNA